jgi:hypothetical protein
MSFGLHLFLSIVWMLITLAVYVFAILGLIKGIPILAVSCGVLALMSSVFVIRDYQSLTSKK